MTNEIPVTFGQVKKILHLADIHIRLYKRHAEYDACFKQLYRDLHAHIEPGTIIVVAGDIVHSKTDMSPELVNMVARFFKQMASLAPTIVIPGNHDLNLANKSRLDVLSPIVDSIKHHNLHYLKDSGVYRCADVDFAVLSIIGNREDWPTPQDCTADTKIALFHDAVFGATTDVGFSVQKQSFTVDDFAGFDMVLLGDIHRHQTLKTSNPVIVYPGSLIQQNHGEPLQGHGWCEWDVASRTFQFHELPNEYGYCTIEVFNQVDNSPLEGVPAKPYLRVFTRGLDHSQVKILETFYRTQRDVQEWAHTSLDGLRKNVNVDALGNIIDITNVELQNTLIRNYLKEAKPELSEDSVDRILQLNSDIFAKVVSEDMARKIVWKPLSLKFDNLFTYGEGNSIDFTSLHDVVGIFAPNATGKTSIAEAICFALYDKTPRATKAANIMNTRSTKCYLEFRFEIEGNEYVVERRGTKNKKGEVKIDVDFHRLENGIQISLNGSERRYTNENIRQYVGDFEEFLLTTFSSSSQQGLFVDRGQSERKNLLGQFLGLKIFDEMFEEAKRQSKDLEGVVTRFRKDNTAQELSTVQAQIEELEEDVYDADKALEITNMQLNAITTSLQEQFAQKIPLPNGNLDLLKLEAKERYHQLELEGDQQGMTAAQEKLAMLQGQLERAEYKLATEYAHVQSEYDAFRGIVEQLKIIQVKITAAQGTLSNSYRRLQQLEQLDYDPNCPKCVINARDTIAAKELVKSEILSQEQTLLLEESRIGEVNTKLNALQDVSDKYNKYQLGKQWVQDNKIEISRLETEIAKFETAIEKDHRAIKEVNLEINEYYHYEESIFKNRKIDEIITTLEAEKTVLKRKFTIQQADCKDVAIRLAVATQKSVDLLARIDEAAALEAQYEAFKTYLEVIGKDGLPYKMIAEILPSLQLSVNLVLAQTVNFRLEFEAESQNINIKLVYDDGGHWPLELASGMEKFISSLAIRVALSQISALPKSTFLILDEGLGALDAENQGQMYGLFDTLRTQFDFVMLITHIDAVKDVADQLVEIERKDNFSKIVVQ